LLLALCCGNKSNADDLAQDALVKADVPLFTFHFETSILLWFAENSRPIAATALALAMTLSMLSIINNVQDIMRMLGKGALDSK